MNYLLFIVAGLIRYFLSLSKYAETIRNRVEVSTPLNSWKRVLEGVHLYKMGIDPYEGDVFHSNPLVLYSISILQSIGIGGNAFPLIFIFIDLLSAFVLYQAARIFVRIMYKQEQSNLSEYSPGTSNLLLSRNDLLDIPSIVATFYLLNPFSILSCVGQTTTVFSNFLLSGLLLSLARKNILLTCICLAFESQINFYPYVLIVPATLMLTEDSPRSRIVKILLILMVYGVVISGVHLLAYSVMNKWTFLDSTYGFIFYHRDLKPNIGLFWYFFTEMFDHFHTLFLYTFQINATILYMVPLTVKLYKQPLLLLASLAGLTTIFRPYPSIEDIAFYMALIPLWKKSLRFMSNNFIAFAIIIVTSIFGPTVWYLWIYCRSANANFYFGATLAFVSAQIFIVVELFFAISKREFCLRNGPEVLTNIVLKKW